MEKDLPLRFRCGRGDGEGCGWKSLLTRPLGLPSQGCDQQVRLHRELFRRIPERIRRRTASRHLHQGPAALRTARSSRARALEAGWRAYGPKDMERASEIVTLRALGFSLAQVARVLTGDARGTGAGTGGSPDDARRTAARAGGRARRGCARCAAIYSRGQTPTTPVSWRACWRPRRGLNVSFGLLVAVGRRTVRAARHPAPHLHHRPAGQRQDAAGDAARAEELGGVFVGLDRRADPSAALKVRPTVALLVQDGATETPALIDLLAGLDVPEAVPIVVDLVEQGLDKSTQEALIAHLRRRGPGTPPLFVMTRSNSILDLDAIGADETILSCPANHSPPVRVAPHHGTPGYEALVSCLATPEVRGAYRRCHCRAAMTGFTLEFIA